jgi:pyruvate/2-oxoglutarate dehydrogenase complex dihydrolipoamide acyltransferase (E2) component
MMNKPYWFIAVAIALGAVIGASLATVSRKPESSVPLAATTSPAVSAAPQPATPSAPVAAAPFSQPQTPPVTAPSAPSATPAGSATPPPSPPAEQLTANSKVTIKGIGPVQIGMTVKQASQAAGVPLVTTGSTPSPECEYYTPQANKNLGFMVTNGHISRIDVWRDSQITTASGLGIGSTEDQIKARFPGQVETSPHEYTDGLYVAFVPKDASDRNYRIVFETDRAGRVTQFRAGKLPEVMWVEGCA